MSYRGDTRFPEIKEKKRRDKFSNQISCNEDFDRFMENYKKILKDISPKKNHLIRYENPVNTENNSVKEFIHYYIFFKRICYNFKYTNFGQNGINTKDFIMILEYSPLIAELYKKDWVKTYSPCKELIEFLDKLDDCEPLLLPIGEHQKSQNIFKANMIFHLRKYMDDDDNFKCYLNGNMNDNTPRNIIYVHAYEFFRNFHSLYNYCEFGMDVLEDYEFIGIIRMNEYLQEIFRKSYYNTFESHGES